MRHLFEASGSDSGPDLSTRLEPDFSHVDRTARISVSLVRTLRIPDDGRVGTVPSGLGRLPMARAADLDGSMPGGRERGPGIVIPVYQSEALRVLLESPTGYPFAVKVLADGLNLATGRPWRPGLARVPRNHLIVPGEHHVDAVPGREGRLRQLAARPLDDAGADSGVLRDAFTTHGLQLVVTPLRVERRIERRRERERGAGHREGGLHVDPYDPDDWDERHAQTCFLRFVQAQRWQEVTGHPVPHPPISRDLYYGARVPWLEHFQADLEVPHQGRSLRELDEWGWGRTG